MDVKQAVKIAADYVSSLEGMTNEYPDADTDVQLLRDIRFAVEGTRFDEEDGCWRIEVGFSRPWDQARSPLAGITPTPLKDNRTIKTVTIDDKTGKMLAYGGN